MCPHSTLTQGFLCVNWPIQPHAAAEWSNQICRSHLWTHDVNSDAMIWGNGAGNFAMSSHSHCSINVRIVLKYRTTHSKGNFPLGISSCLGQYQMLHTWNTWCSHRLSNLPSQYPDWRWRRIYGSVKVIVFNKNLSCKDQLKYNDELLPFVSLPSFSLSYVLFLHY